MKKLIACAMIFQAVVWADLHKGYEQYVLQDYNVSVQKWCIIYQDGSGEIVVMSERDRMCSMHEVSEKIRGLHKKGNRITYVLLHSGSRTFMLPENVYNALLVNRSLLRRKQHDFKEKAEIIKRYMGRTEPGEMVFLDIELSGKLHKRPAAAQ